MTIFANSVRCPGGACFPGSSYWVMDDVTFGTQPPVVPDNARPPKAAGLAISGSVPLPRPR